MATPTAQPAMFDWDPTKGGHHIINNDTVQTDYVSPTYTSLDVLGRREKLDGTHPQQASHRDFWMSGFL